MKSRLRARANTILLVALALAINLGFFMSLSILGAMRSNPTTGFDIVEIPFSELRIKKKKRPASVKKLKPHTKPKPSAREKIERCKLPINRKRITPRPRQINSERSMFAQTQILGLVLELDNFGDVCISSGTEVEEVAAESAPATRKEEYEQGEVDAPPKKLTSPPPRYPRFAKDREIEGWVRLKLLVDSSGGVAKVQVLCSQPPGIFDEAATNAVRHWSFIPAKLSGKSVPTWCIVTIFFKLED